MTNKITISQVYPVNSQHRAEKANKKPVISTNTGFDKGLQALRNYNLSYVSFRCPKNLQVKREFIPPESLKAITSGKIKEKEVKTPFDTPDVIAARKSDETGDSDKSQDNSPNRVKLRRRIADKVYGKGAPIKNKQVYFVIGVMGSGKSTLVKELASKKGAMTADSDNIKKYIPEYNGSNAKSVHLESIMISDEVTNKAIEKGDNLILESTLRNPPSFTNFVHNLKSKGYEVHLRLVQLDPRKAIKRAINRWHLSGRFVDPLDILCNGNKKDVAETFLTTAKNLKNDLSSVEIYSSDVPLGQAMPKISEKDVKKDMAGFNKWKSNIWVTPSEKSSQTGKIDKLAA